MDGLRCKAMCQLLSAIRSTGPSVSKGLVCLVSLFISMVAAVDGSANVDYFLKYSGHHLALRS